MTLFPEIMKLCSVFRSEFETATMQVCVWAAFSRALHGFRRGSCLQILKLSIFPKLNEDRRFICAPKPVSVIKKSGFVLLHLLQRICECFHMVVALCKELRCRLVFGCSVRYVTVSSTPRPYSVPRQCTAVILERKTSQITRTSRHRFFQILVVPRKAACGCPSNKFLKDVVLFDCDDWASTSMVSCWINYFF